MIEKKIKLQYGNLKIKSTNGQVGDKRFIISAVWWRKWTDFVNFDAHEPIKPQQQI